MILDGNDPRPSPPPRGPCAAARCWACPPKPCTAWPPTPAATLPWRRSLPPRAAQRPPADRACGRCLGHCALCRERARFAQKLVDAFWPGPLTLILPRRPAWPRPPPAGRTAWACAARPTRWPMRCCRPAPAMAPNSAPVWGWPRPAPTALAASAPPRRSMCRTSWATPCWCSTAALRGGHRIHHRRLHARRARAAAPGRHHARTDPGGLRHAPLSKEEPAALTPRASGTLEAHYAPAAKVRLMDAKALQTALDLLGADAAHIAVYARSALRTRSSKLVVRRMPDDASASRPAAVCRAARL
jgi:L-threonylcarbamoyladenylate synthase